MRKIYLALFAVLFSAIVFAQSAPKFGLGWYSMSAPVGGRLWVNPVIGFDLGLGYADKNFLESTKDRFHLNAGIVFNAVKAGDANFFIRPGVEFQSNARTVGSESRSKLIVTADLGVEWFASEQFSLSVGHGLQFEQLSDPTDESKWGISALRALSFSNVGFHFYFN
ncbi:MAG TPA: hypothetical protein VMT35_18495 [Ignavibacteriaceae bacterium]|nr:hypothetical protein [Ignavibacteriaceae bacterium]